MANAPELTPRRATITLLLFDQAIEAFEKETGVKLPPERREFAKAELWKVIYAEMHPNQTN